MHGENSLPRSIELWNKKNIFNILSNRICKLLTNDANTIPESLHIIHMFYYDLDKIPIKQ